MSAPIVDQPAPMPNDRRPVWELVIEDMAARDRVGRERYGTPLQTHNGRDALVDAYQEALDLVVYLRQAIEERSREQPETLTAALMRWLDENVSKCGHGYVFITCARCVIDQGGLR